VNIFLSSFALGGTAPPSSYAPVLWEAGVNDHRMKWLGTPQWI